MSGKRVLLGITASAAAFKGVALASAFRRRGFEVDAVLTPNAARLVSPRQLACITARRVLWTEFADDPGDDPAPHVRLTEDLSLMVIAPATADFLARLSLGLGDDLLTTTALACNSPMVVAPAMHNRMWRNPVVQEHVERLRGRGVVFAGPVDGDLACGDSGAGRMMEPPDILQVCLELML
ncbi:hypothetical protein JW921_02175 [Candidatus Fermentibacterales bacterium]|nr:hypothetical protein [Candidatus Fermentibacterales bacterium]